ncbi:hypothetical protein Tco_1422686 [Tanacetum coccineum]
MVLATTSLIGFSGETIGPLGQLRLVVTIGDAEHSTKAWMNFMIVRSLSPYNGIIGRPGIKDIQAVWYGYITKRTKTKQMEKTEHGNGKSVKRRSLRQIYLNTFIGGWDVAHDPRDEIDGYEAVWIEGTRLEDGGASQALDPFAHGYK